jgi:GGDEF domain-containing protein
MALEYETRTKFTALAPVLERYTDWFGQIAVAVAYPNEEQANQEIKLPKSFKQWAEEAESHGHVNKVSLKDIKSLHDEMMTLGADVIDSIRAERKPIYDEFLDFKNMYDAFLTRIRRLERDNAIEGSGIDEKTGLRNKHVLKNDIKREMDRLARQGNEFTLVMSRIDKFECLADTNHALLVAVSNIKQCIRTFDDAYYLDNGEFLLSLRHADTVGAQAAISRLQQYLRSDNANNRNLTLSFCLAEPVESDAVDDLIDNMRKDLANHKTDEDAVLQFVEQSPLNRFIESMD